MQTRPLGKTGLSVTPLCLGTSPLGNFPSQYGYEVDANQAVATVHAFFRGPMNFLDTSNNYGEGRAEERIGRALREIGGLPANFVMATKVDPLPGSSDFSGARVRASVAESLRRLGTDRLQLVYLHDPERMSFADATAPGGAVEALVKLRDQGVVEHIGVAGGPIDLMRRYLDTGAFEAVISHNRYTLVDSSAQPLIQDAVDRDIAFVNAAPYGGGMLVRGPDEVPNYCYRPATAEILDRVREIERACSEHAVPLAAAALQYSLRDDRVASTIVGMSNPDRIEQTLRLADFPVPEQLWERILPLARAGRAGVGL